MPCQGPSDSELRHAKHHQELYKLMLNVHKKIEPFPDGYRFLSDEKEALLKEYLHSAKGLRTQNNWFDSMSALLCETIDKFTVEQEEHYLYNGRSKVSRKLADWWETHQKFDRERKEAEILEEAYKQAKEKADEFLEKEYNKIYKILKRKNNL